jgi:hypothetical protein
MPMQLSVQHALAYQVLTQTFSAAQVLGAACDAPGDREL